MGLGSAREGRDANDESGTSPGGSSSSSSGGSTSDRDSRVQNAASGFESLAVPGATEDQRGFFERMRDDISQSFQSITKADVIGTVAGLLTTGFTGSAPLGAIVAKLTAKGIDSATANDIATKVATGQMTAEQGARIVTQGGTFQGFNDDIRGQRLGEGGDGTVGDGGVNVAAGGQGGTPGRSAATGPLTAEQEAIQFQREFLTQQRSDILEAVDSGIIDINAGFNQALDELRPFGDVSALETAAGLREDPSKVFDLPGVQFQFDESVRDIQNAFSRTSGGGVSGNQLRETQRFGQEFQGQQVNQALSNLKPFIDLSTQARQNLADLEAGRGTATSNLRLGGATGTAGITGTAGQNIAATTIAGGKSAATDVINKANVDIGRQQLLADVANQATQLFASRG